MPFFQYKLKDILSNYDSVSLQVQGHQKNKKIKDKNSGKRVCPFTSLVCKGSITIEATIALTIFMGMILFIIGFIMMINTAFAMQIKINNIALTTAKSKFYLETADKITNYSDNLKKIKSDISESKSKIANSGVWKQIQNIQYAEREPQEGIVDIIMRYSLKAPVFNKYLLIQQRSRVKDWTGVDLTVSQDMVYITQNGKVYHTTKECSHLALSISKSSYSQLRDLKNCYGEAYSRCSICATNNFSETDKVFITEDGNRYHSSLTCRGLTRNIIAVDKENVGDKKPCSGCAKGE